ncbi:MAG TPA: beta-galactosidase [Candidatus Hydrogenedentes bacterium]|nr:beta-galactosidase [Candidatus Hydrogenedentota bacterium]HPG68489.1 beta-galactosidase [Candidatus Hydrogenedentota bacterium]
MFRYGVCYYPEHWNAKQAEHHLSLMRKAQINVVRMGEFAWCRFEPDEGQYAFDWLDQSIAELHAAGIATVLGTPTCIPPPWAVRKHPGILQQDRDGHVRNPGSRCHACKNAPEFRALAEHITRALARHYADVPGVIGWQTDNEFGCHGTTRCYCDHCEKAFRLWLQGKYHEVEHVNEAWGTAFWGSQFRHWNEIPLPRSMPAGCNPGHWLDFARFSSDTQIDFHKAQFDIIKEHCPNHFVTHNFMGRFSDIDYYRLARLVDFPVWDNYPDAHDDPFAVSYAHEITRSFKGTFWVMEEKSGPTGDATAGLLGEQPEPGEIRRWTWQAVANGADGICYFRWRPCLTGAEQYWHGILDHDGKPRRRYAEVRRTGEEIAGIASRLEGRTVRAYVALIRSFEVLWSFERQPAAPGFRYDEHCLDLYHAVKRVGHGCAVVDTDADIADYRVVLAPALSIVGPVLKAKLEAYVKAGGTLVLTPQSGARTPTNAMLDMPRPGLLADLAGLTVEEIRPYHHGQQDTIRFVQGPLKDETCAVGSWVEWLECDGADVFAEYTNGIGASKPAIACNTLGQGRVLYLGVMLPRDVLARFLADILPDFPIKGIPEGVEVTRRRADDGRLIFLINHTAHRKRLVLPGRFPELLTGERVGPKVTIGANGVLVLQA